jgi:hypothetical protein
MHRIRGTLRDGSVGPTAAFVLRSFRSAVVSFALADRDWGECGKLTLSAVLTARFEKDAAERTAQGCHGLFISVSNR